MNLRTEWVPEWNAFKEKLEDQYFNEIKNGKVTFGNYSMFCKYSVHDQKPVGGYRLIFGFHGGGGCPPETNNDQYRNHFNLYDNLLPRGSIWFIFRSAENLSDMWWRPYM
jgi:hypothetical protein